MEVICPGHTKGLQIPIFRQSWNDVLEIKAKEQKISEDGIPFPYIMSPFKTSASAEDAIKSNKALIEKCLEVSGAVILRGFKVKSASDFNKALDASGWEERTYLGGEATRRKVVGRVYTANEGVPLGQTIGFHNEGAYLARPIRRIVFYCDVEPPLGGGATTVIQGHVIYQRMVKEDPKFIQQLEQKKLRYSKVLREHGDGSWRAMFQTDNREKAEIKAASLGSEIEWLFTGAKFHSQSLPGVITHPTTGQKTWFNALSGIRSLMNISEPGTYEVSFGDGTPIPEENIQTSLRIMEEEHVAIPWQQGDILIVDNLAVLHGRQASASPRSILVSLCA